MDNDDILQAEDVATARASVVQTRRKVLVAAVVTPLLIAILVFLAAHYLTSLGAAASLFPAAAPVLLGIPAFIHWLRHYQSILRQLDALDHRVSSGETLYGSQVVFHSYR